MRRTAAEAARRIPEGVRRAGESKPVTIIIDPAATNHPFAVWDALQPDFVTLPGRVHRLRQEHPAPTRRSRSGSRSDHVPDPVRRRGRRPARRPTSRSRRTWPARYTARPIMWAATGAVTSWKMPTRTSVVTSTTFGSRNAVPARFSRRPSTWGLRGGVHAGEQVGEAEQADSGRQAEQGAGDQAGAGQDVGRADRTVIVCSVGRTGRRCTEPMKPRIDRTTRSVSDVASRAVGRLGGDRAHHDGQ